jgi:hypothetical protein
MEHKQILQEFEGCIDSVDIENKTFWAKLFDITQPRYDIEEMAEFDFSVFEVSDHQYIKEGSLFDWTIGEIVDEHNVVLRSFSDIALQKRNRKEQAAWRKKLVKCKKEATKMSLRIKKMCD